MPHTSPDQPADAPQPTSSPTAQHRVGVYVCRCGGNISDVIDVEQVADQARNIPGVCQSKVHMFMCSDPGQQEIIEDVQKMGLDRVIVASCSPFLHEETFRNAIQRAGLNPYLYEHVNIREQGSWAHLHDPNGATVKAVQLIQAAVGKTVHSEPLESIRLENHPTGLIIGGGIAGMKAAIDLGRRGIDVILVEKASRLGGRVRQLEQIFPQEVPSEQLVTELQKQLEATGHVDVLLQAEVQKIDGFVGNFDVTITGNFGPDGQPDTRMTTVGAVVVATGFEPYAPHDGELGYQTELPVVTTYELIELLRQQEPDATQLRFRGRTVRSVAFIHCVGSRQVTGVHQPQPDGNVNLHCSRVCCTTVLQQAVAVKQRFPDTHVYDLHQDIRTYGLQHEDYYLQASDLGVLFLRYRGDQPPHVTAGRATAARITVTDDLTWGEEVALDVDLAVLAVGMMPGRIKPLSDMLKLSVGSDRFLQEVHPKLRPVEVAVHGVLLAGTAQGPMTIDESLAAAAAAAAKATVMLSQEHVERDPFVATVNLSLCHGAGHCVEQCEYDGALKLVEMTIDGQKVRRAQVNPGLCEGCGACVAVCPTRAIQLSGWTLDQFNAMVDGIAMEVPGAEQTAGAAMP